MAARRRRMTIVAFSGEMDRLQAALTMANGAVACGMEATVFFTFWSLAALRDPKRCPRPGGIWLDRLLRRMLPTGSSRLPISNMNFGGAGAAFFRYVLRTRKAQSLRELLADARELGVRLVACQMSLGVLGLSAGDLLDNVETGGLAGFLEEASDSAVTLFV